MSNLKKLIQEVPYGKEKEMEMAGSTKQILYKTIRNKMKLYLPGYLSLTFNSINQVNHQKMKAQIHCEIKLILDVKQFEGDPLMIDHIKKSMYFFISTQQPIKLDEDKEDLELYIEDDQQTDEKQVIKHHYITYIVNKTFVTGMIADVVWTPFDIIKLTLSINPKIIDPFKIKHKVNYIPDDSQIEEISFEINLMKSNNKFEMINNEASYKLGVYSAATRLFAVEFINEASSSAHIEEAIKLNRQGNSQSAQNINYGEAKSFQYAHFHICLFRNPFSGLATIFVPLLLLSIVNLGIYAQTTSLAGRIQNLAALMFAFIQLFPIIRQQIPPSHQFTLAEGHFFLIMGTTILCLFRSIGIRDTQIGPFQNDWAFIVSLVVTIYVFLASLFVLLVHFCFWKPKKYIEKTNQITSGFNHKNWNNLQCNKHFMKFFDSHIISPLSQVLKNNI